MSVTTAGPQWDAALRSCRQVLRRVANSALDPGLDQRVRDLGERKEFLTPGEHQELLALVAFTQQRTLEKLEAELALRLLQTVAPEGESTP